MDTTEPCTKLTNELKHWPSGVVSLLEQGANKAVFKFQLNFNQLYVKKIVFHLSACFQDSDMVDAG